MILLLIGLLFVIGLGYYFVYVPSQRTADRQRFLDAEAEIEKIFSEHIEPVAQPNEVVRDRSCDYASGQKYSQGDLSCSVSFLGLFEFQDSPELIQSYKRISEQFGSNIRRPGQSDISTEKIQDISSTDDIGGYQVISIDDESCSVGYTYNELSSILEVLISCTSPAITEHFPLESS